MYSLHNHTEYSNASRGFADSSIKLKDLVLKAKEYGLSGIAITDHEIVGSYVKAKKLEKELDFPVLLGNEIYLVNKAQDKALREGYDNTTMYYPHFLLIALDSIGNQQLRKLSTIAWENSYVSKRLVRTTTLMSDIEKIIGENKGHVIGSTACLGSFLNRSILNKELYKQQNRKEQIKDFILWGKETFGENNFYLECQPAYPDNIEQWTVNNYVLKLSKKYNVPYIITTDSHYLSKDLLNIHSSFLNSDDKEDEREVEKFYATAYLMGEEELRDYFKPFWTKEEIDVGIQNTIKIGNRAERYILSKKQVIPKIKFKPNWENEMNYQLFPNTEYIQKTLNSEYEDDRYLMYLINKGINKLIPQEDYQDTFIRLEEELKQFWLVSEHIEDRLHAYFTTIAKIIDIIWNEGDSIIGVGRGSCVSSIICYLLEITQINPLKMPVEMPFYRFVDEMRPEIADIDIDTQSDRRTQIFEAIKEYFNNLGGDVINCCTYSTLSSKAALLTACRGLEIDNDTAQTMTSLIPVERGFNWSIKDTYYGDEENNREPIKEFVNIVNQHEGLLETVLIIEGIIINRGTHAGGVFLINGDVSEYNAVMKSLKMVRTSQFELSDSEDNGLIKIDLLTTKGMTKIRKTLDLLIEDNLIEKQPTLKETYMKYLNPMTIDYNKPEVWELVAKNEVIDLFQFDTTQGIKTLAQIKPHSMIEMAQANSLVRLQKQEDADETPVETYVKFKNDKMLPYKEMDEWNVPGKDQKLIEEVLKHYNFVADTQEAIMSLVRIPEITNFNVGESHKLRKAIAKKSEDVFYEVRDMFYKKGIEKKVDKNTLDYIWEVQIKRQKGYSFSILHCIAYTYIALQQLILYNNYPPIYWNTACLTINASADEEDMSNKTTSYGKIAKAIGQIQEKGIRVKLPDINTAGFEFTPDAQNNEIIFGLRGIHGVGSDMAYTIINNRPYNNIENFIKKTEVNRTVLIKLVKAGCFDNLYSHLPRNEIMLIALKELSKINCEYKDKLEYRNFRSVISSQIIPEHLKIYETYYNFRQYIINKRFFHSKIKGKNFYYVDNYATQFFKEHYLLLLKEDIDYFYDLENNQIVFAVSSYEKIFNKQMGTIKKWLSKKDTVQLYNDNIYNAFIQENWDKYCQGSLARWSMNVLSYYPEEHELKDINRQKYSIENFYDLSKKPIIIGQFTRGNKTWDKYRLSRICGTVLDKNKIKGTITLLTLEGVVDVRFYKGNFIHYDRQISKAENNTKTILEKSWFTRGNCLMISGIRQGEMFYAKKYYDSVYQHTVCLIEQVLSNGDCILKFERERGD